MLVYNSLEHVVVTLAMASSPEPKPKDSPVAKGRSFRVPQLDTKNTMLLCLFLAFLAATITVAGGQNAGSAAMPHMASRAGMKGMAMPAMAPAPELGTAFAGGVASDMASDAPAAPRMSKMSARGGLQAGAMASVVNSMDAAAGGVSESDPTALTGPVVIKSATMNIETKDVASVMQAVQSAVEALGGFVESGGSSTDEWLLSRYRNAGAEVPAGPTHGHMQLRVPAAKLDNARAGVQSAAASSSGRVTGESSHGQDVTGQYVDVLARQRVQEKSLAALEELLKAANNVQEVLQVKRELDMVVSQLESSKAQRKSMESRATMSSLSLSLAVPQPPDRQPPPPEGWTAGRTLAEALAALGKAGQGAASVAIYTAVFAVPLTIVGLAALGLWTRILQPMLNKSTSARAAQAAGYTAMK